MALGDLDDDGDQDVVINQLNECPILLRNLSNRPRLKVVLKGGLHNTRSVGARLVLRTGSKTQSRTVQAGGRYLSSDGHSQTFALSKDASSTASMSIEWPDGSQNQIHHLKTNQRLIIQQPEEPLHTVAEKETSREMVFIREQTIVPDHGVILPPPPSLTRITSDHFTSISDSSEHFRGEAAFRLSCCLILCLGKSLSRPKFTSIFH